MPPVVTVAPRRIEPTTFVAVLGDTFADDLTSGLRAALADRPEVGLVTRIKPGSGLAEEGSRWNEVAREVAARKPLPQAAVIFLGEVDPIPTGDAPKESADAASGSPMAELYATRVDEVLSAFRGTNMPVIWVGLPPVADEAVSADHAFVNEFIRQRLASYGGTYIDVWEGFVDADGHFTPSGPNIDGAVSRLRAQDGVRFTRAGARKLAHYVEIELRRILDLQKDAEATSEELSKPDAQAPRKPGVSRLLILSTPPRAAGGVLVSGDAVQKGGALSAAQNALAEGRVTAPQKGRADDFSWGGK